MIVLFQWLFFSLLSTPVQEGPAVRFEITNAGITVNGYFKESTFTLAFDPENLKSSSLAGKVKVASIQTGIGLRDRHLQGRQYFVADTYPEISMWSKSISREGNNTYLGVFYIRIKEITREAIVPFRVEKQSGKLRFTARFTLNRLDYGIGENSLILSNEVTVLLDVSRQHP
ncbi:MAG: YceI family protein [Bacteroidetes bacterium]|nr:YceI family protein [Bacteroidota bacterium]